MIAHVVLFRPKPDLSLETRQRLERAFTDALAGIESIRRARIGRRIILGRSYEQLMRVNYTHAAVLEFEHVAALKSYLEHPAHETLGALFMACFEESLIYDFELADGLSGLEMLAGEQT